MAPAGRRTEAEERGRWKEEAERPPPRHDVEIQGSATPKARRTTAINQGLERAHPTPGGERGLRTLFFAAQSDKRFKLARRAQACCGLGSDSVSAWRGHPVSLRRCRCLAVGAVGPVSCFLAVAGEWNGGVCVCVLSLVWRWQIGRAHV